MAYNKTSEEVIDFYIEDGYICIECEEFLSYGD